MGLRLANSSQPTTQIRDKSSMTVQSGPALSLESGARVAGHCSSHTLHCKDSAWLPHSHWLWPWAVVVSVTAFRTANSQIVRSLITSWNAQPININSAMMSATGLILDLFPKPIDTEAGELQHRLMCVLWWGGQLPPGKTGCYFEEW